MPTTLSRRPPLSEAQLRDDARLARMEAEFIARHGVREFMNSERNILRLFRSAGAPREQARAVQERVAPCGAQRGAFDHGRLFGRDGRPTLLVGHPYELWRDPLADLDRIRRLGLVVQINGPLASFHGHWTCQVLVFAPPSPGA